ncbi:MAG: DUF1007 family protein [Bacteroidales bacterium]|nr:DUF1007 family protein [Bacteroidales bacterium]
MWVRPKSLPAAAFFVTLALALAGLAPGPAQAHPHVWVIATGELVYDPDGAVTGVRFAWEFDDMFSAFATQGLDTDQDGKLSRQELAELAQTNVESLKEFDYFTFAKLGSRKLAFAEPIDYYLEQQKDVLVLHFTLPLQKPIPAKGNLRLEVYDPTVFVSFSFAEGDDALKIAGAPAGCSVALERPKPLQPGQQLSLSEAFLNDLTASSDFGAQFANRATVKCP